MSVMITGRYLGDKKALMTHGPSRTELRTAAPVDNQGDGSSFSPTDLLATALGSCMLTVMSIKAENDGMNYSGAHFSVEKIMSASPRRVGELKVEFHLPRTLTDIERQKLEKTAATCPVHHSLHPDVKVDLKFHYDV